MLPQQAGHGVSGKQPQQADQGGLGGQLYQLPKYAGQGSSGRATVPAYCLRRNTETKKGFNQDLTSKPSLFVETARFLWLPGSHGFLASWLLASWLPGFWASWLPGSLASWAEPPLEEGERKKIMLSECFLFHLQNNLITSGITVIITSTLTITITITICTDKITAQNTVLCE